MKIITALSVFFIIGHAFAATFPGEISDANNNNFLAPQKFPTTFQDLSFTDRIQVLSDGYAPWESEYDENGVCVSGCAYPGITMEEEATRIERNTRAAMVGLREYTTPKIITENTNPVYVKKEDKQIPVSENIVKSPPQMCQPSNTSIPSNQNIPLGNPLVGQTRITSPYGPRINPVTKNKQLHSGIDFSAPIGTYVFAPANGSVEKIIWDNTCGNGLRIAHSDGFSTLYCHLSNVMVKQGQTIDAGCPIAQTGNTGRSTGPHLHYGIYYNKEKINPTDMVNGKI